MNDPYENIPDGGKYVLDGLSLTALVGTLFAYLPEIAAVLTIVWTAIRILETETVRGFGRWLFRRKP